MWEWMVGVEDLGVNGVRVVGLRMKCERVDDNL
jgi:hypothetical protein